MAFAYNFSYFSRQRGTNTWAQDLEVHLNNMTKIWKKKVWSREDNLSALSVCACKIAKEKIKQKNYIDTVTQGWKWVKVFSSGIQRAKVTIN